MSVALGLLLRAELLVHLFVFFFNYYSLFNAIMSKNVQVATLCGIPSGVCTDLGEERTNGNENL